MNTNNDNGVCLADILATAWARHGVISATNAKRQHGARAMTVLRRIYIWHKQKAAQPAGALADRQAQAAHHASMMHKLDIAQRDLKALG